MPGMSSTGHLRQRREKGGGIALGVIINLKPFWISEGDDDCESITVKKNKNAVLLALLIQEINL